MSRTVDNIDTFHEYGVYFPTKTVKIFGEITPEMKDKVITNLHALDKAAVASGSVITILLSTEGGNIDDGLAIYDAIRAVKAKVQIIAYGEVSSMGSVIFQAADEGMRFMTPNSFLMVHGAKYEPPGGDEGTVEAWFGIQKHQEEVCNQILLNKVKEKKRISRQKFNNMIKSDWILIPDEAIKYGLADAVVEGY